MAGGYNMASGEEETCIPGIRVDRGLVDCARYIRDQPPATAVAQEEDWISKSSLSWVQ